MNRRRSITSAAALVTALGLVPWQHAAASKGYAPPEGPVAPDAPTQTTQAPSSPAPPEPQAPSASTPPASTTAPELNPAGSQQDSTSSGTASPETASPEARSSESAPPSPAPEPSPPVSDEGYAELTPQTSVPAPKAIPPKSVRVAVTLAPAAPGTKAEKEILARIEKAAIASTRPVTEVRRLRPGAPEPRQLCREGRDDLVISVDYLPDRDTPVVVAYDCVLDRGLSVYSAASVNESLVAAYWTEHDELLKAGVQEKRRGRLNPKLKTALIAGSASLVVAVAVGILVASSLRRDTVVLTVSP